MGMYDKRVAQKSTKVGIHPAWIGIGFILMIVIPVMSFAASDLLIESNLSKIAIPGALRSGFETGVFGYIRYFPAKVVLAIVISIALFSVLFMIYAAMYKMSGQTGRGPMDAPPSRIKVKKRSR